MKTWSLAVIFFLTSIFARAEITNAIANPIQDKPLRALILKGKQQYEAGKLADAAESFALALKLDPKNKAASYYLDLVKEANYRNKAAAREEREYKKYSAPEDILPTDPPKSAATGDWLSMRTKPNGASADKMQRKQFRLDRAILLQRFSPPEGKKNRDAAFHENFNEWLKTINIDWSSASFFYTDSISSLAIQATHGDLAAMELALKPFLANQPKLEPAK